MTEFTATRAAGLAAMAKFAPAMGRRYANGRNTDHGPGRHKAVSCLSPWIRRRLVTEPEAVAAALATHGPEGAEKFIDEVVWRGYFKGWLERRPQVWDSYRHGLTADLAALERDRRLRRDVERATEGGTGLDCFDAWATELVETGYLHNHARMWFASIWIFTFGLPWRLGADFFYRHLLDGDAASNTLGWRWVAGLHTRGKPYPARADNIATFTAGRFAPRPADLADVVDGLEASEPDGLPPVLPLRSVLAPDPTRQTVLLITDEDCRVEEFPLAALNILGAATLTAGHLRSSLPVSDAVLRFEADALADAAARAGFATTPLYANHPDILLDWARAQGATQIVTPYVTRGPLYDWLAEAQPVLAAHGITLAEWRRDWDSAIWPHATAGFFKVRQQIPLLLHAAGSGMMDVAIIGAGMAGLACACRLVQAGLRPVLFDKGRGIGGRLATRRVDGLQFDHGAQYVTARDTGFAAVLRDLAAQGTVAPWDSASGTTGQMVGTPGMSALARALGAGLDIRQSAQVSQITAVAGGWSLRMGTDDHMARRLVITVPAPQVAGLLGADHPMVKPLARVVLEPCLTLMAGIRAPAPFTARRAPDAPLAWIAQDSSKPARPVGDVVSWVAQAGLAFSMTHLEDDPARITDLMLPLLLDALGVSPDAVSYASAHRWRYARVAQPLGQPFLCDPQSTLYLGGDWCIGPRVEAAWLSGTAIGDDLLAQSGV